MKKAGWVVFVLGFVVILAGIAAKRVFGILDSVMLFHVIGGILLIVGGMMAFSDRRQ